MSTLLDKVKTPQLAHKPCHAPFGSGNKALQAAARAAMSPSNDVTDHGRRPARLGSSDLPPARTTQNAC
jgi:hypothetical protein